MIISNNCVGARLYQQLNKEYDTPFIWCRVYYDDILHIIDGFKNVLFENYKLIKKEGVFGIRVDDSFDIMYPHYIKDEKYKVPTQMTGQQGLDIRYCDIENYVIEKYKTRIARITSDNMLYVLIQTPDIDTYEKLTEIQKKLINKGVKSIIVTNVKNLKNFETKDNKILVSNQKLNEMSTIAIAKEILKKIDVMKLLK